MADGGYYDTSYDPTSLTTSLAYQTQLGQSNSGIMVWNNLPYIPYIYASTRVRHVHPNSYNGWKWEFKCLIVCRCKVTSYNLTLINY